MRLVQILKVIGGAPELPGAQVAAKVLDEQFALLSQLLPQRRPPLIHHPLCPQRQPRYHKQQQQDDRAALVDGTVDEAADGVPVAPLRAHGQGQVVGADAAGSAQADSDRRVLAAPAAINATVDDADALAARLRGRQRHQEVARARPAGGGKGQRLGQGNGGGQHLARHGRGRVGAEGEA